MTQKHQDMAELCCNQLSSAFPTAGIGICGSVAKGVARVDSDVDLVVMLDGCGVAQNAKTQQDGLSINVQVFFLNTLRADALGMATSFMPFQLSYLRHAVPHHDPAGLLAGAICWANEVFEERCHDGEKLVDFLHGFAKKRHPNIQPELDGLEQHVLANNLLETAIQAYMSQSLLTAESAAEGCRLFCEAIEANADFRKLVTLREMPISACTKAAMEAIDFVFENASLNKPVT